MNEEGNFEVRNELTDDDNQDHDDDRNQDQPHLKQDNQTNVNQRWTEDKDGISGADTLKLQQRQVPCSLPKDEYISLRALTDFGHGT